MINPDEVKVARIKIIQNQITQATTQILMTITKKHPRPFIPKIKIKKKVK